MKQSSLKKQRRTQFYRSFFITLCVLGLTTGLLLADYNTRLVSDGGEGWTRLVSHSDRTFTLGVGGHTQTVSLSPETEKLLDTLCDLLPAPLRLWGMGAEALCRLLKPE